METSIGKQNKAIILNNTPSDYELAEEEIRSYQVNLTMDSYGVMRY